MDRVVCGVPWTEKVHGDKVLDATEHSAAAITYLEDLINYLWFSNPYLNIKTIF